MHGKGDGLFTLQTLRHIFHGDARTVGSKGRRRASGYHYEGAGMRAMYGTRIVEETRSGSDRKGVYSARVDVEGKRKRKCSPFFPREWSKVEVLRAIREAHATRKHCANSWWWVGRCGAGFYILLRYDATGQLATAVPVMKKAVVRVGAVVASASAARPAANL
jgi:toxin YxiD